MKKVHKSAGTDDKKLQTSLKKLNVQPIQAIEEVNMFKEDGNVIHFAAPKGGSISCSLFRNNFAEEDLGAVKLLQRNAGTKSCDGVVVASYTSTREIV